MQIQLPALLALALAAPAAAAAEPEPRAVDPDALFRCAEIVDEAARLDCYDALAPGAPSGSYLERRWDLRGEGGRFRPIAHRPVYVLPARWTDDPNEEPFRAVMNDPLNPDLPDVQPIEAKFQISFKTRLVNRLFGGPGDLWFGYTQQSHFQIYNASASRPFRETDFEPELIVVFPSRQSWGKWTWRLLGAGIAHQSNGRGEPLSRSWNRIYALAAIERGKVSIEIRPWARFDSTDPTRDDNPGISELIGRAEVRLLWDAGAHVLSVRGRSNLEAGDHDGSLQVDWFFPLGGSVRGQVQIFTGSGESLIDYNHRQTTFGVGVLLFDPF